MRDAAAGRGGRASADGPSAGAPPASLWAGECIWCVWVGTGAAERCQEVREAGRGVRLTRADKAVVDE